VLTKSVIVLIKIYRNAISPLKASAKCRFIPTCSQYGIDAIGKYGIIKGGFMLLKRILKCNPLGSYGYDPVD
jgi:putative membrane protein insertion efficiency factor